eukprot:scaffold299882_cov18-Tisochrysis_lutea.AAC.1
MRQIGQEKWAGCAEQNGAMCAYHVAPTEETHSRHHSRHKMLAHTVRQAEKAMVCKHRLVR